MRMIVPSALILQIIIGIGCGESPSALEAQRAPEPPSLAISDAAHGGRDGFYFLPPLVPEPEFDGVFDPLRQPVVQICELDGDACPVMAEYTLLSGPDSVTVQVEPLAQRYGVDWHTDRFSLTDGATYRIRVLLEGRIMGYVDVNRVGTDLESTATGEVTPLENGSTLPIRFRLETELRLGAIVPTQAPNSVPEGFYDESNWMQSPCIAGPVLKDIVVIMFEPEATQLQRQQTVDEINGEVVGGIRLTDLEGSYYVQLPTDDTGQNVCDAEAYLSSLPYVSDAGHSSLAGGPQYRRPQEEGQWVKDLWQVNPAAVALTERWGLEQIAAPLAWGCEIGSDTTAVAIVDRGFQAVADLTENIRPERQGGLLATGNGHGTFVASIAAARGNNGKGITGVMWKADLRPYEIGAPSPPPEVIAEYARQAIRDGASVVNVSLGIKWLAVQGHLPNQSDQDDVKLMNRWYSALRARLQQFSSADLPLLVLSAGNDGVDAKWNGFPQVANDFPDYVLVVAASTHGGGLSATSNFDSLVSVAAPGEGVYGLDGMGQPVSDDGTSYSAAYVTGLAGLLKSFDPGLTPGQIKDYIIEGAARGGLPAGQYNVINAYESLRRAAERLKAPLCGNEVWESGGKLHARRTGGTGGVVDELASTAATPVGQVEALHGGKFILYINPGVGHALRWDAVTGDWEPANPPADWQERRGGTWASVFGFSHERDTLAYVDGSIVSGTTWFLTSDVEQAPVWVDGGGPLHLAGQIQVDDLPGPVKVTCLERSTAGCHLTIIENRTWIFRLGYPQFPGLMPAERQAYITVSPMHHVEIDSTPWAPCPFDSSHECRAVLTLQDQTEALVYRMNLAGQGGSPSLVTTIPDESVFWMGHSEMGEEVVLGRGRWDTTFWADAPHYYQTGSPFFDLSQEIDRCTIDYRREADFGVQDSIPAEDACNFGLFDYPSQGAGGGTIAPSLIPALMTPRASITAADGAASVRLPILDPTGQEVRARNR